MTREGNIWRITAVILGQCCWLCFLTIKCAPVPLQPPLATNNTPPAVAQNPSVDPDNFSDLIRAAHPAERAPAAIEEYWLKDAQEQIIGIFRPYQAEENLPGTLANHPFLRAGLPLTRGQMGAREMALNFLNDYFQLQILAPRVEINYPPAKGGSGVVQAVPAGYFPFYRISNSPALLAQVQWSKLVDLAILDMISGNLDSSYEQWMVDKNGALIVVGKSWAFPAYHAAHLRIRWHWHRPEFNETFVPPLQTAIEHFNQTKLPEKWQHILLTLDIDQLTGLLKAKLLLADASLHLMKERIEILQQTIKQQGRKRATIDQLATACLKKMKNL